MTFRHYIHVAAILFFHQISVCACYSVKKMNTEIKRVHTREDFGAIMLCKQKRKKKRHFFTL